MFQVIIDRLRYTNSEFSKVVDVFRKEADDKLEYANNVLEKYNNNKGKLACITSRIRALKVFLSNNSSEISMEQKVNEITDVFDRCVDMRKSICWENFPAAVSSAQRTLEQFMVEKERVVGDDAINQDDNFGCQAQPDDDNDNFDSGM